MRCECATAARRAEEVRVMTEPMLPHLEDELARLRRLRDIALAILQEEGSSREEKLQAIEHAFEGESAFQAGRDEDAEAEEVRDRERLS
jgi:hypothetical protein